MEHTTKLAGKRFGRLVAKEYSRVNIVNEHFWHCECDCGAKPEIRERAMVSGNTKSCGCYRRELRTAKRIHDGILVTGLPVVDSWAKSVDAFIADMGLPSDSGYVIRKHDESKPYSKDNCYWSDVPFEHKPTSMHDLLEYNGETKTLLEWSEHYGIGISTVQMRVARGWVPEKVFGTKVRRTGIIAVVNHNGAEYTLPKLANVIGINYRTLLSKLRRGIKLEEIVGQAA